MGKDTSPTLIRVGFDVGGTFTDILISASTGEIYTFKVLSEPQEIAQHVAACIRDVLNRVPGGRVDAIVHGTTVASNAVIENKRAATGYLTTSGFRDEIEFTRPRYLRSTETVGMYFPPPTPLVPRHLRLEIGERISATGEIERPLDTAAVEMALDRLVSSGIEALAICLINAHVNPAHELQIAEIAATPRSPTRHRGVAPGIADRRRVRAGQHDGVACLAHARRQRVPEAGPGGPR